MRPKTCDFLLSNPKVFDSMRTSFDYFHPFGTSNFKIVTKIVHSLNVAALMWLKTIQDGRLPPVYFPPSNFIKDAFEKNESVFFDKYFHSEVAKEISKKYYHLIRILEQICHLYRFWKTSSFFSKNPKFSKQPKFCTYLRNLANVVAFFGKYAIIWWQKMKVGIAGLSEFGRFQLAKKR